MKTFTKTFASVTDYVAAVNLFVSRQCVMTKTDFGYTTIWSGELYEFVEPR